VVIKRKKNILHCKVFTVMYMSTDNIEVEVNEVELDGVDWIVMAKDRDKVLDFTILKMELFFA